jgi:ankyrin repeat protein
MQNNFDVDDFFNGIRNAMNTVKNRKRTQLDILNPFRGKNRLQLAFRDGDVDNILHLLTNNNTELDDRYDTLQLASVCGYLVIVEYLILVRKMDPNKKNKNGYNALRLASQCGHLPVVKFFIDDCKMNPNETDMHGYNVLQLASKFGYLPVVQYVIQNHEMNPSKKDKYGYSAIQIAFKFHHLDILMYFIKMGFLHNTVDLEITKKLNMYDQRYEDERFCEKFYTRVVLSSVGFINIYI